MKFFRLKTGFIMSSDFFLIDFNKKQKCYCYNFLECFRMKTEPQKLYSYLYNKMSHDQSEQEKEITFYSTVTTKNILKDFSRYLSFGTKQIVIINNLNTIFAVFCSIQYYL